MVGATTRFVSKFCMKPFVYKINLNDDFVTSQMLKHLCAFETFDISDVIYMTIFVSISGKNDDGKTIYYKKIARWKWQR